MANEETDLFDIAVGLLVKKDRRTAGKMKEEDFVREIDRLSFQLDAMARSHLLTSITLFKEGVLSLFKLLDKSNRGKYHTEIAASPRETTEETERMEIFDESPSDAISTLSRGLKEFELTNLNERGEKILKTAGEDFHQARLKAIEAFNNDALSTLDRIQAIAIRVAAKILENVDQPEEALASCKMSLEDLHSLKGVPESFGVELTQGFRARFYKDDRRQIIASVCRINRAIYDVMSKIGISGELLTLPLIGEGKEAVNPLHDSRVAEVLGKLDMEQFFVQPLSLGQEDEEVNKPKIPQGIAADSQGHIIVGDDWDRNVKVFDHTGHFQYSFSCLLSDNPNALWSIADVATDRTDNVYVLIEAEKSATARYQVYVVKKQATLHCFPLREEAGEVLRLTFNKKDHILVLVQSVDSSDQNIGSVVEVYNKDGKFQHSFGDQQLKWAQDLSVSGDDRILVLDRDVDYVLSIHVFSPQGKHAFQFKVKEQPHIPRSRPSVACYQGLNHVVVAYPCMVSHGKGHCVKIAVYTMQDDKHEIVRSIELATGELVSTRGIAVTFKGHIAIGLLEKSEGNSRVLVV